jgi:ASC-1-like (ASCH) protein
MATYDACIHVGAFEAMERGQKTVYALLHTDDYMLICAGDRLEFGTLGSITVGTVRRYKNLEALVETEGWNNLVPGAEDCKTALEDVRAIAEWDDRIEKERGVLCLRVREARRKI